LTPERLLVCFRPPPFAKPGNETMLADGSAMSEPHCRPPEKLMVELALRRRGTSFRFSQP